MSAEGSAAHNHHLRYKGKVTIVTGGSKGIGEGIVREFGKNTFILQIVLFALQYSSAGKEARAEPIM